MGNNVKTATRSEIFKVYQEYGLNVALNVAQSLLGRSIEGKVSTDKLVDIKTGINGELCESVLEILVTDYCKRNKSSTSDWYWTKSMILKDPKGSDKFLTELDFTLFTPECIYLFECKSYSGDKTLRGNGILVRNGKDACDVYKQSCLHVRVLNNNVSAFTKNPRYRIIMFNFSKGTIVDTRDDKAKAIMPCVTCSNWDSVLLKADPVWDMSSLLPSIKVIEKASDKLRPKHLEYVKSLKE